MNPQQAQVIVHTISSQTVVIVGASFVLGSLFTLFMLVIMDLLRRRVQVATEPAKKD